MQEAQTVRGGQDGGGRGGEPATYVTLDLSRREGERGQKDGEEKKKKTTSNFSSDTFIKG